MSRHATYSYSPQYVAQPELPKQYPTAHSTSSAFSASANPNEDWTKISDLAERRRIQNRIAQRNYRKKLKKRLEDLERRAGSSSASPEHQPAELSRSDSVQPLHSANASRPRSTSSRLHRAHTPEVLAQQYVLPSSEDRGMFSQQYTRQLSTSPPPFSYGSIGSNDTNSNYASYSQANAYCNMPQTMDLPIYPSSYVQPMHQAYANGIATPPIKQEFYAEDEINPFSMSYASIAGVDVSAPSYQDVAAAYTPSLSDSLEHHSPPDHTAYPRTPASMPRTPPMNFYDRS